MTDGRTIAFPARPGTIRVLPAGAAAWEVDVGAACGDAVARLYGIGAGQVLFGCEADPFGEPRRLELASGTVYPVPGAAQLIAENGGSGSARASFDGIGSFGVSYLVTDYKSGQRGALDWRTGTRVPDPRDATSVIDLDRPALTVALCAPLRRVSTGPSGETPFWPFQYRVPYGLSHAGRLVLRRCGSSRRVVLPRDAYDPQLGTRVLTLVRTLDYVFGRYRAEAHALSCGRRMSWPARYNSRIAPLTRSVVISEPADGFAGSWRIRQVSLRGICRHAGAGR